MPEVRMPEEEVKLTTEKIEDDSDIEEDDRVFSCSNCELDIIRNSNEHDNCVTCDDKNWFCQDCAHLMVVFSCEHCGLDIVRNSDDHDNCVSSDGVIWYCQGCEDYCEGEYYWNLPKDA